LQVVENKPEGHDKPNHGYWFKVSIAMVFEYVTNSTGVTDMVGGREKCVKRVVTTKDT
jgi:hypothetical protein